MEKPTNPDAVKQGVGKSSPPKTGADTSPTSTSGRSPVTLDEGTPTPRRASSSRSGSSDESATEIPRLRRSSTFSRYSFSEVGRDLDEVLDPGPELQREVSMWRSKMPLMFAVFPPVIGLVFKNGSSFFTDVILLGLASVFLHWSITSPWKWYHASQQIREDQEAALEESLGAESVPLPRPVWGTTRGASPRPESDKIERTRQAEAALRQLRTHELIALAACFLAPVASTYLLHFVRNLLSRPSEGLVSNFNLTIFLLSAEINPCSHSIKLILSHTMHLQRIVNSNPYRQVRVTPKEMGEMLDRIDDLEMRLSNQSSGLATSHDMRQMQADTIRSVRTAVQPEIEALNRAVRRYEKQVSLSAQDTDRRLRDVNTRVDDLISLTIMAQRNAADQSRVLDWIVDTTFYVATLPLRITIGVPILVLRSITGLFGGEESAGKEALPRGPALRGGRLSSARVSRAL